MCFCVEPHVAQVRRLCTHAQRTQQSVSKTPYRERLARKAAIPALASQSAHTSVRYAILALALRAPSPQTPTTSGPLIPPQSRQARCALLAGYLIPLAAVTHAVAAPCLTRMGHGCSRREDCAARAPAHCRCLHATCLQECSIHLLSGFWRASFRLIFSGSP
jgi:hypothetical protein